MSKINLLRACISNDNGAKAPIEANMKGKITGYSILLVISYFLYVGCFGVPV